MSTIMNTQNSAVTEKGIWTIGPVSTAPPTEPTTIGIANELLNFIATLESHCSGLRGALFGEGANDPIRAEPTTLQAVLSDACQRAASLCGDLATIKARLGI